MNERVKIMDPTEAQNRADYTNAVRRTAAGFGAAAAAALVVAGVWAHSSAEAQDTALADTEDLVLNNIGDPARASRAQVTAVVDTWGRATGLLPSEDDEVLLQACGIVDSILLIGNPDLQVQPNADCFGS